MNTITVDEAKMLALIQLYSNSQYDLNQANAKMVDLQNKINANVEPFAPSIDQFNKWQQNLDKFSVQYSELKKVVQDKNTLLRVSTDNLRNALPPNKWIRIGEYYIGKRTCDWPDSPAEIMLQKHKPSIELQHQIIN